MSLRLIGMDGKIEMAAGGPVDGAPSYGAFINYTTALRSVDITNDIAEIDVSGLEPYKYMRPGQQEWTLTLRKIVRDDWEFVDGGGSPVIGHYIKVRFYALATGSYHEYEGFVAQLRFSNSGANEVQIEEMQIRGPVL